MHMVAFISEIPRSKLSRQFFFKVSFLIISKSTETDYQKDRETILQIDVLLQWLRSLDICYHGYAPQTRSS